MESTSIMHADLACVDRSVTTERKLKSQLMKTEAEYVKLLRSPLQSVNMTVLFC